MQTNQPTLWPKQLCNAVLPSKVCKSAGQGGHMFGWYNTVQLHHDIAWVDAEKSFGIAWGNVEGGREKPASLTVPLCAQQ